jgi:intracellular multiplication protein IcmL
VPDDHNGASDPSGLKALLTRWSFVRFTAASLASSVRWLAIALCISLALNFKQSLDHPRDRFIMIGPDGQMVPNTPLDEPVESDAQVLEFAGRAAEECGTYGFADFRLREEQCRHYFSQDGFVGFLQGLQQSRAVEAIQKSFANQTATRQGVGVLISATLKGGSVYSWKMQIPMLATTSVGPNSKDRHFILELTVVRVSPLVSLPPIAVDQWNERDS